MDFQFSTNFGEVTTHCSMGHEAFAHWLNIEVSANPTLINKIVSSLEQATQLTPGKEISFIGSEYSLFISADEVLVKANHFTLNEDDLEQNFHYYDAESFAGCGREDFIHFITAYITFIKERR